MNAVGLIAQTFQWSAALAAVLVSEAAAVVFGSSAAWAMQVNKEIAAATVVTNPAAFRNRRCSVCIAGIGQGWTRNITHSKAAAIRQGFFFEAFRLRKI
jgi:hypothetical protein